MRNFDPKKFTDANPSMGVGDIFIHTPSGRQGEISRILTGAVEAVIYAGATPPDNEIGNLARRMGITRSEDLRLNETLALDSVSVRRPSVGAVFSVRTPDGLRQAKVVRHLEQGFVEVQGPDFKVYAHGSELYDPVSQTRADASTWPQIV